jgi:hypothetical protein
MSYEWDEEKKKFVEKCPSVAIREQEFGELSYLAVTSCLSCITVTPEAQDFVSKIEESKKRFTPLDDKICQVEKIILGIFPTCKVEVVRKENEYRNYLEFRIKITEAENYQQLAAKFMQLHKQAYLCVKEPGFEYSFDITQ